MTNKRDKLESWGFIVGNRDPRLNTDYSGDFMVAESYNDSELPTKDGSNGPWCIVGNDLETLISEAYEIWWPDYELDGISGQDRKSYTVAEG